MKLSIYLLENRKTFLHVFLSLLYLIILVVFNWENDGKAILRSLVLIGTGAVGIGVAYVTRYLLILAIRRRRWLSATCWFLLVFPGFAIMGYLLFHGFDSQVSRDMVDSSVQQHLWKDYARSYVAWWSTYAKYGVIFFKLEKQLYRALDMTLGHWSMEQTAPTVEFAAIGQQAQKESEPEHVTISWILDFLNVGRSTFYRSIRNQILFEVCRIGNRPYYLKSEVTKLMIRHEKGCWTFSKYLKQQKK